MEESVLEVLRVRLPKEALHDRLQLRIVQSAASASASAAHTHAAAAAHTHAAATHRHATHVRDATTRAEATAIAKRATTIRATRISPIAAIAIGATGAKVAHSTAHPTHPAHPTHATTHSRHSVIAIIAVFIRLPLALLFFPHCSSHSRSPQSELHFGCRTSPTRQVRAARRPRCRRWRREDAQRSTKRRVGLVVIHWKCSLRPTGRSPKGAPNFRRNPSPEPG